MKRLDWSEYRAALLDLDGVLTPTAQVHAAAWKETFDDFLAAWNHRTGGHQPPFDTDEDYRQHVDGRPRYHGVAAFLASRSIDLPRGAPDDRPGHSTLCAVGNAKNRAVTSVLTRGELEPYPGSVRLLDALDLLGVAVAVVSASANAEAVLEAAGITDRFAARVDGVVARDLGLAGKPRPDTFLEAARRLGVEPSRAVVVEDAVAGVEAGVAGGFGTVVGVDRHGDPEALARAGADVVVTDLSELVPEEAG